MQTPFSAVKAEQSMLAACCSSRHALNPEAMIVLACRLQASWQLMQSSFSTNSSPTGAPKASLEGTSEQAEGPQDTMLGDGQQLLWLQAEIVQHWAQQVESGNVYGCTGCQMCWKCAANPCHLFQFIPQHAVCWHPSNF